MASITKAGERWRARYRDNEGKQHERRFAKKMDAQRWLDEQTAALVMGAHVSPRRARTSVGEWCDVWLAAYASKRKTSVNNASSHISRIKKTFGTMQLGQVRPSQVKTWIAQLQAEGLSDSYINALHGRLMQVYIDAIADGYVAKSPCSRRTSPAAGRQRPYVATTEQVWAIYDAFPEDLRLAVLLAAFAGLRNGEACGLRPGDVDFMRDVINPAVQYPSADLKTDMSYTPVPIAHMLTLNVSAHVAEMAEKWGAGENLPWVLCNEDGLQLAPIDIQIVMRDVRAKVPGLPPGFRYHDLRHYYASLLIESGANIKVVQARLRHASATTTLNTYGHLWPDSDDATRNAVSAILRERVTEPREEGAGEA